MGEAAPGRDYALTGPERERAIAAGLAGARWYSCPVPRQQLKALMQRRDGPALRDTAIWLALLAGSGAAGALAWGSWWAVPAFLVYGVLYGSSGDSRWHECGHGTAFRTRRLNDAVYWLACFFILREPTWWRWSHARHHTDTIIVGRDPEIAAPRPPRLRNLVLDLLQLHTGIESLLKILRHCGGRLRPEEEVFIPPAERPKVIREARIFAAILLASAGLSIGLGSLLPLMLVGLPTFSGGWLELVLFGYTQHAGLAEDVLDHRLNARTVHLNPVFRFLYWNMNYHVEHHMFPMVPYHALPRLHQAIKDDCPPPYPSLGAAWREILPTLIRQTREPGYFVRRDQKTGIRDQGSDGLS
jgi:fatty acid desaturase